MHVAQNVWSYRLLICVLILVVYRLRVLEIGQLRNVHRHPIDDDSHGKDVSHGEIPMHPANTKQPAKPLIWVRNANIVLQTVMIGLPIAASLKPSHTSDREET
jgi:hypothetical protein